MAGGAVPLGFLEIVDVDVSRRRPGYNLIPLDCLDVAQVVVVQNADRASQYIWGKISELIVCNSNSFSSQQDIARREMQWGAAFVRCNW